MNAHLAMAAKNRIDRGERQSSAEFAARREFGNGALIAETTREMWGWTWMERLWQDARYGVRCMRRSPGFTAVAVVSLALGIGANTAIFSLVDAVMLRWLPVRDPQTLLMVKPSGAFATLSYPAIRLLAEQREVFSSVGGFNNWTFPVGPAGAIRDVRGALVSGGYYEVLGLRPVAGRLLTPADDEPGAAPVAVITDGYWSRQFARAHSAVGETIRVNGVAVQIVGVSPAGFTGVDASTTADITMAASTLPLIKPEMAGLLGPGNFWLLTFARAPVGLTAATAATRLRAVWPRVAERAISPAWPEERKKGIRELEFEITTGSTGWTHLRQVFRKPLLVLMGIVGLVLLIACANVANLLLARSASRQREIAVRLAIGAGRWRIVRQTLTESVLLAATGAAAGIGLAVVLSRTLVDTIASEQLPMAFDLSPNWRVLAFTAATAVATGLLFGLAPALQSTSSAALRGTRRGSRLLSGLVTVQVGLSLALVIGAGLFVQTLRNLENLDPGFRREGVLLVDVEGRRSTRARELVDAAREVPGVVSASIATHTPLSGSTWSDPVALPGQPMPKRDSAIFAGAAPGFFETMGIPLLAGRGFAESDTSVTVAVVSEEFARRFFHGRNPVGERVVAMVRGKRAELEIVGLAKNAAQRDLRAAPYPAVYVPHAALDPEIASTLVARGAGSLGQAASGLQKAMQARLPERSISVRTLSSQVDATIAQERLMARLAAGFGVLALVLACVGLYGLLNYGVARRTREIGIRMALGAQRAGVVGDEVRSAGRLVAGGIALGLPAVWIASRWIRSMLFGLAPTDLSTIVGATFVLVAAALGAACVPARRAARVDPMTALRHE